jgi:hypothetical protein
MTIPTVAITVGEKHMTKAEICHFSRFVKASALVTLLFLALLGFDPFICQARENNPGDRVRPLSGLDLVSHSNFDIEKEQGSWVLVDFCQDLCSYCRKSLFQSLEETEQRRISGQLKVVLVSLQQEPSELIADALKTTSHAGISWIDGKGGPVIIGERVQPPSVAPIALDWAILRTPTLVLVSPEGVIANYGFTPSELAAQLNYFLDGDKARRVGLRCTQFYDSGSNKVHIVLDAYNPRHEPCSVQLDYRFVSGELETVGADEIVVPTNRSKYSPREGAPEVEYVTFFEEGSTSIRVFDIDLGSYLGLEYRARLILPGTEAQPLFLTEGGDIYPTAPTYTHQW